MENFFDEVERRAHAWPAGRRDLHWHALFDLEDVRRALTDPYRDLTHREGLEPVAPEWVHMTVLHSGPEQDATAEEIEKITELVRRRCAAVEPIEITFGRPTVGRVAIECPGRPGAPVRRLWQLAYEATTEVVGNRWPLIPQGFYPHATLAYAGAEAHKADRRAMKIWLSDHGPEAVTLRADRLSLVSQWHDGARIVWDHIEDIPLGSKR
ncbi:2'-5' RNA ligase family protein [Streptoverticillium reticulum]|uniref:2'-5' RNA ligase family protein n=1 Tax=Streptoverticillium reticulum TaxID=1433415 RepID=UPI0039BFF809